MLKTNVFLLEKHLKLDSLDYLMNDIRFILRLINELYKDNYKLSSLFFYSFFEEHISLGEGSAN